VGKLRPACDVANGEGTAVGGAQSRVDGDAFCRRGDAGGREIERLDARAPSRGDQEMRADNLLAARRRTVMVSRALDAGDRHLGTTDDALG
jgi:hypothetical protein